MSVRAREKLAPSLASGEGTASACSLSLTIVIARAPAAAMFRLWPSLTAEPLLKSIVPKLDSGNRPPRPPLGASSTHSADECDDVYGWVCWYVWPVVLLVNSISHWSVDCSEIETVTESPA